MDAIFGLIKKTHYIIDNNDSLIKKLKSKSASYHAIKGINEIIIGSIPPLGSLSSNHVYSLGELTIIANARIDNRIQLSSKLNIPPSDQKKMSDAELILICFQKWNKLCLEHLEGDFAFAIWNQESQELFSATDHLGQRSLYYHESTNYFIICSCIKELTALVDTPKIINDEYIINYYFRIHNPANTFDKNIHLLPAGSYLSYYSDKPLQINKYWVLLNKRKYAFTKDEDWYACARTLIFQSIEKRISEDKQIGITLSGGLDSSSIACILASILKEKNRSLYAFSSVLPLNHQEKDERPFIEHILQIYDNIDITYIELPESGTFQNLEKNFYIDEAIPNTFHYVDHAILKAAQYKGVNNLFTGYGGDFWISWKGESVIFQLILDGHYQQALGLLKASQQYKKHSILASVWRNLFMHIPIYKGLKSKLSIGELKSFFRKDFIKNYSDLLVPEPQSYKERTAQKVEDGTIGKLLTSIYNRNQYYGIDSSVPFFDKSLLEFFLEVPQQLFIKNGVPRSLLRESMKGILPEYIRQRPDKRPYAPDFKNRLENDKDTILKIVNEEDTDFIFEKYIDKSALIRNIDMLGTSTFHSSQTSIIISLIQTINIIAALKALKKQQYLFV
ncbi:asparagine synthase-related protein [Emticicia fontis]